MALRSSISERERFGFRVYCGWVLFAILALSPLIWRKLYKTTRILCWLGPIALALDVDAGNRTPIYIGKLIIWVLMQGVALTLLRLTRGFQERHSVHTEKWAYPAMGILFVLSCGLTIGGKKTYADYKRVPYAHLYRRINSVKKTYLRPNNAVYVYSPVAHYRILVVIITVVLTGAYHVIETLYEKTEKSSVTKELLLWLTLPTITIPALVRLLFGSNARFDLLLQGLLPVETDTEMRKRLCISSEDLYAALANAGTAVNIFKEDVGIVCSKGSRANVQVNDLENARNFVKKSLLETKDGYLRISDGIEYSTFEPGTRNGIRYIRKSQREVIGSHNNDTNNEDWRTAISEFDLNNVRSKERRTEVSSQEV
eukprot:IDg6780t1